MIWHVLRLIPTLSWLTIAIILFINSAILLAIVTVVLSYVYFFAYRIDVNNKLKD